MYSQTLTVSSIQSMEVGKYMASPEVVTSRHTWTTLLKKISKSSIALWLHLVKGPIPVEANFRLSLLDHDGNIIEERKQDRYIWVEEKYGRGHTIPLKYLESKNIYNSEKDSITFRFTWELIGHAGDNAKLGTAWSCSLISALYSSLGTYLLEPIIDLICQYVKYASQVIEVNNLETMEVEDNIRSEEIQTLDHRWSILLRRGEKGFFHFWLSLEDGPVPVAAKYTLSLYHRKNEEYQPEEPGTYTWTEKHYGRGARFELDKLTSTGFYEPGKLLNFRFDWEIWENQRNLKESESKAETGLKSNGNPKNKQGDQDIDDEKDNDESSSERHELLEQNGKVGNQVKKKKRKRGTQEKSVFKKSQKVDGNPL